MREAALPTKVRHADLEKAMKADQDMGSSSGSSNRKHCSKLVYIKRRSPRTKVIQSFEVRIGQIC